MRKGFKKLTALLLLCTLLTSMFAFSGCTYGGVSTAYNVKESLIKALNNEDYDEYIALAYPPLREQIEKEMDDLGLSEKEYMKHLKKTVFPFADETLLTQSSKLAAEEKAFDDTQLQLVCDQYIYLDDYIELDSASSTKFLVKDYRYTDEECNEYYLMEIVIVSADGHYYFSSYNIEKQMFDFDSVTTTQPTETE